MTSIETDNYTLKKKTQVFSDDGTLINTISAGPTGGSYKTDGNVYINYTNEDGTSTYKKWLVDALMSIEANMKTLSTTTALHTHSFNDITDKPQTYPPSSHTHLWNDITDKPSTFTPSSHTHAWSAITGKPSTFTPAAHNQAWSTITGKPSSYTPASHNQSWTTIKTGDGTTSLNNFLGNQVVMSETASKPESRDCIWVEIISTR